MSKSTPTPPPAKPKLEYSWAVNLHGADGDTYEACVLVFLGDKLVIRLNNPDELKDLAFSIAGSLPEITESFKDKNPTTV